MHCVLDLVALLWTNVPNVNQFSFTEDSGVVTSFSIDSIVACVVFSVSVVVVGF